MQILIIFLDNNIGFISFILKTSYIKEVML